MLNTTVDLGSLRLEVEGFFEGPDFLACHISLEGDPTRENLLYCLFPWIIARVTRKAKETLEPENAELRPRRIQEPQA